MGDYYFEGRGGAGGGEKEKMRIFILCLSIRSEKVRERIKLPSRNVTKILEYSSLHKENS